MISNIIIIAILITSFEEPLTRPHSEAKTWAPSSVPSAPQSAPPELAAQHKSQHSQYSGYKSPESESVSLGSFSGINGHKDLDSERNSPLPTNVQDTSTKDEKVRNETIYTMYRKRNRTLWIKNLFYLFILSKIKMFIKNMFLLHQYNVRHAKLTHRWIYILWNGLDNSHHSGLYSFNIIVHCSFHCMNYFHFWKQEIIAR